MPGRVKRNYLTVKLAPEEKLIKLEIVAEFLKGQVEVEFLLDVESDSVQIYVLQVRL